MAGVVAAQEYGRSGISFVAVDRQTDGDRLREITANVRFEGAFEAAFTVGDNSSVLPTETMVNTVLALAHEHVSSELEVFGIALTERFLTACAAASATVVELRESPWDRQEASGGLPAHSFCQASAGGPVVRVRSSRGRQPLVSAGIRGVRLLKTGYSGFTGFLRDEYTTTPERTDRMMGVILDADWQYAEPLKDYGSTRAAAEAALTRTFGDHVSASTQQTLHRMGTAVLEDCSAIARIALSCAAPPAKIVDLQPFGRVNDRQIYVVPYEPHSVLTLTLEREPVN